MTLEEEKKLVAEKLMGWIVYDKNNEEHVQMLKKLMPVGWESIISEKTSSDTIAMCNV